MVQKIKLGEILKINKIVPIKLYTMVHKITGEFKLRKFYNKVKDTWYKKMTGEFRFRKLYH
jgi:hypothetical protein